ncbi:gibberellin-regulated protein 9-like [Cucurbita pepo subsp. pepo]|uniref:gibberellin-regulated protein 9-like n=1 Tax=Cucurbita pepo subsp. pepo TaxID=3664 RepID=UPI000C9D8A7E|nr:gibberellin-regulated protein 9-like [Cucurbita pepo subsp. pepo]
MKASHCSLLLHQNLGISSSEMKPLSVLCTFVLLLLFLQGLSEAFTNVNEGTNTTALNKKHIYSPKINCKYACSRRCMKVRRKKICMRACGSCCSRCHCVPPGTYGNHQACPCYARLRTHGNRLKCP